MIESPSAISSNDIAAHYDSLDSFYRDIWGEHVHHGYWENGDETKEEATLHLSRVLANWLDLEPGDKVCDLGCGYGGTSRFLADHYGADVTGYTLSAKQKEFADTQSVNQGAVQYIVQDFMKNDREAGSFDAIISIECMEHMPDKRAVFDEAFRILKPGKTMSIALWSACENPNRLQRKVLEDICKEGRLPSLPSGGEYERLLGEAGFEVEEKREIGDQVRKTWSICARGLAHRLLTDSKYRSFLMNAEAKDRVFALTLLRILVAFRTKTMRYWIFKARKPEAVT